MLCFSSVCSPCSEGEILREFWGAEHVPCGILNLWPVLAKGVPGRCWAVPSRAPPREHIEPRELAGLSDAVGGARLAGLCEPRLSSSLSSDADGRPGEGGSFPASSGVKLSSWFVWFKESEVLEAVKGERHVSSTCGNSGLHHGRIYECESTDGRLWSVCHRAGGRRG